MRMRSGHRYFWWFRAWLSKNPLLREPTRAERLSTVGAALLCLLLVLSVPVVAVLTWGAASARIAYPKEIHTVQATVTTPRHSAAELSGSPLRVPPAKTVRWQWHGQQHTGHLPATATPAPGDVTPVRVNEDGKMLSSLYSTGNAVTLTVLAAVAAAAIASGLAFVALRLRGRWLLRRRTQSWEREWEQVQPRWTGRGHKA